MTRWVLCPQTVWSSLSDRFAFRRMSRHTLSPLAAVFMTLMLFQATYVTRDSQSWTLACVQGYVALPLQQLPGCGGHVPLGSTSITIKDEDGNAVGIGGPTKVDVTQAEVENAAHHVSHLLLSPGRCWRRLPYIRRSPAGGCAATLHGCSALHRPAAVHRPTAPP